MKIFKSLKKNASLNSSLYFCTFPFFYFVYHLEKFLFLLLLATILSQTRLVISEVFYYIKWGMLIGFLLFEYLILNFINLKRTNTQRIDLSKSTIMLIIFLLYQFPRKGSAKFNISIRFFTKNNINIFWFQSMTRSYYSDIFFCKKLSFFNIFDNKD